MPASKLVDLTELHMIELSADGSGGLSGMVRWNGEVYDLTATMKFKRIDSGATLSVETEEQRRELEHNLAGQKHAIETARQPKFNAWVLLLEELLAADGPVLFGDVWAEVARQDGLEGVDENNRAFIDKQYYFCSSWRMARAMLGGRDSVMRYVQDARRDLR